MIGLRDYDSLPNAAATDPTATPASQHFIDNDETSAAA